jgi:hypothetical protein
MSQKAFAYYLDVAQRILATRTLEFTSRADLVHQVERDLDGCWSIEVWQGSECLICAKAHGAFELRCGKPNPPAEPGCGRGRA